MKEHLEGYIFRRNIEKGFELKLRKERMKVVWLTSICPQFISARLGKPAVATGGWLEQSGQLLYEEGNDLTIIFPSEQGTERFCDNKIKAYAFKKSYMFHRNDEELKQIFIGLLKMEEPDVIHIHGTEFPHSYAMTLAAESLGIRDKCVISIQGLVSIYYRHYYAGLPYRIIHRVTLRDLLKRNIYQDAKQFKKRGVTETLAVKNVHHIIGRTNWDRALSQQINNTVEYHECNETLRKSFYSDKWEYDKCIKHSIFVSQSSYPIKAFHNALEALIIVLKTYDDAKLYVTGDSPFNTPVYRIDSYKKYIKDLIIKNNLKDKVVFTGILDEEHMKEYYLKANVFVICSSIENSPNSLGEAMILGVPCVASDVGGISTLFTHEKDGYLYPFDEPYMLAHYICKVFQKRENQEITEHAIAHAKKTHDVDNNYQTLMNIYRTIQRVD